MENYAGFLGWWRKGAMSVNTAPHQYCDIVHHVVMVMHYSTGSDIRNNKLNKDKEGNQIRS